MTPPLNEYTNAEIASMQKDAMRRVNEMQRIARQKINATAAVPPPNLPAQLRSPVVVEAQPQPLSHEAQQATPVSVHEHHHDVPTQVPNATTGLASSTFAGILDKLKLDDEKILLILLIFVLINEGADLTLILALGYILL